MASLGHIELKGQHLMEIFRYYLPNVISRHERTHISFTEKLVHEYAAKDMGTFNKNINDAKFATFHKRAAIRGSCNQLLHHQQMSRLSMGNPLTHCGLVTTEIWVNIGSCNGLLPDGNKPLLEQTPTLIFLSTWQVGQLYGTIYLTFEIFTWQNYLNLKST